MNSLLATPPEEDKVSDGRLGEEAEAEAPTLEAEAETEEAEEVEYVEDDEEGEYDTDEVEEEEEVEQPDVYTVKVDGEEYEVTQDELLNGYQRQQAYTKRSQELAEQRKAFEAEAAQVAQMRDAYAQQLEQLSQQLNQVNEQEPDWAALAKEYSAEDLIVYKAQLDQQKEYAKQVEAEKQAIAQQQAQEQQAQMQQHLASQREEMLNRIPQWRDEDIRTSEREQVIKYAQQSVGFSPQEIANASDARAIELLYKAWQWDNLQQKKPAAKKKASKAPKMAKAGQPKTKAQVASRSRQRSLKRLNNERSVDAAVNYLMGN
jgi:hypothetical protein